MDENYLDDLLKGVSTDNQKKNNFDKTVDKDSGVDIDFADLDDISLDEFDSLDDISLDDLDLDELEDVDFDDLDMTSLSADKKKGSSEYIPEQEEFNADDMLEGIEEFEDFEEFEAGEEESPMEGSDVGEANDALAGLDLDSLFEDEPEDVQAVNDTPTVKEDKVALSADDIDNLFAELEADDQLDVQLQDSGLNSGAVDMTEDIQSDDIDSMDLDDLFSALGIDETEGVAVDNYVAGEDDLDQLLQATMASSFDDDDLADIEDIEDKTKSKKSKGKGKTKTGPKEKKSMSEILFGAPDEDDEEEERLFELKKAEKEAKKTKKQEEKELKKAAKQEQQHLKDSEDAKKKSEKEEKKRLKEAQMLAELEAEKGQKKVPTLVVVIVFACFAALGLLVILGSKNFNYAQVIKKATDYFERQRYRLAYEEVAGVEVKEEDEELRDRIYTVMYVERLYESFDNNMSLGRPDKALDSLLRGLEKYDEHYEEAVVLGIAKDINSVKEKIINSLWNTYGLTEADAYELMELEGLEYSDALMEYSKELMPTGE